MSTNDDMRAMAEQVARQTAESIRSDLSKVAGTFESDREALRAEFREVAQSLGSNLDAKAATIDTRLSEMKAEQEQHVSAMTGAVRSSIDTMVEQMRSEGESVARDIERKSAAERDALTATIEQARALSADAAKAQAQAEAQAEAAQARIEEAERAEANARRAVHMMNLRSEHEVNRATKEVEFKQRRKATLAALEADEDEMTAKFDLEAEVIEKGLDEFYPEMRGRLEELAREAEEGKGDE